MIVIPGMENLKKIYALKWSLLCKFLPINFLRIAETFIKKSVWILDINGNESQFIAIIFLGMEIHF